MRSLFVIGVVLALLGGCGSDGAEPAPPNGSFAVGDDHLCEWLSEEQVAEAATDGYAAIGVEDWDGDATIAVEPRPSAPWRIADHCRWGLDEAGSIEARFDRFPLFEWDEIEIVTHQEWRERVGDDGLQGTITTTGIRHPTLDGDVVALPLAWGQTAFATPRSDAALVVTAYLHGAEVSPEVYEGAIPVAAAFMEALAWPEPNQ